MSGDAATAWRSIHLFVAHRDDLDVLALEAADALATLTSHSDDWFFIRYPEGGLHLRLRIGPRAAENYREIRARMADACAKLAVGRTPEPWALEMAYPDPNGRRFAAGETVDIAYEPETVRYAGMAGLAINEDLFRHSTAVSLAVLRASRDDLRRRVRLAMDLMLAGIAGLCGDEVDPGKYLEEYAAFWTRAWHGSGMATSLQGGASVDFEDRYARYCAVSAGTRAVASPIDAWCRTLAEARARFGALHAAGRLNSTETGAPTADAHALRKTLYSLTHSQMHMLNNRLGLWPHYEIAMAEHIVERLRDSPLAP